MVNVGEEASMQLLVAGGGENNGVTQEANNSISNHDGSNNNATRGRGRRIRKKHLSGEELIARVRHVNMVKTKRTIERKQLLSTYLQNKKRIERLTISIALNTDRKGKPTSFNVRKWTREKGASLRTVHNIEASNFYKKKKNKKKKKKKTPTHIYFE